MQKANPDAGRHPRAVSAEEQLLGLLLLPRLLEVDGVWLAVPCAEALTFLVFLAMLPFCFRRPQKGAGA